MIWILGIYQKIVSIPHFPFGPQNFKVRLKIHAVHVASMTGCKEREQGWKGQNKYYTCFYFGHLILTFLSLSLFTFENFLKTNILALNAFICYRKKFIPPPTPLPHGCNAFIKKLIKLDGHVIHLEDACSVIHGKYICAGFEKLPFIILNQLYTPIFLWIYVALSVFEAVVFILHIISQMQPFITQRIGFPA